MPTHSTRRRCRVSYWTGWLSPDMEGCSKEVFALKDHFVRSRIMGLSRSYGLRASWRERYFGVNLRYYSLLRLLAPLSEFRVDVNHIYGDIAEWFFLRMLGRRPIVMTVATAVQQPLERAMYRRVRQFIAHGSTTLCDLVAWGFDPAAVRILYPGVDLSHFRPMPSAANTARRPFRVLFASAPTDLDGLRTRGVTLLLEAAAHLPDVDFVLMWRPWPGAQRVLQQVLDGRNLPNVRVSIDLVPDMRPVFHAADATVAPFVEKAGTKVCPTSLVESLACGRPVLASTRVGIADVVDAERCGEVFEPTVEGLCAAIERLRRFHPDRIRQARRSAEQHFDLRRCLQQHEALYETVVWKDGHDDAA